MSLKDQKAYPFDWIIPFLVAQLLNKNDKLEGTIEKKQAFIHLFDAKIGIRRKEKQSST